MSLRWTSPKPIRILDWDIETRRIGFHNAGRFNPDGCEPVAIAAQFVGTKHVYYWDITKNDTADMLAKFRAVYDKCDIAAGHYVRKFDLPIINGALLEHGLPLLPAKRISDTKTDLTTREGLSASQENLALMLGLEENKFHMADFNWRAVARLEPGAMKACRIRVVSDVKQHIALRQALLEAGALKFPRVWAP